MVATAAPIHPDDTLRPDPEPLAVARVQALDRLRAVSLLLLLVHHLTDWQMGDARAILPGWEKFAVTDIAAAAFAMAAGASGILFTEVLRRRGQSLPRVLGTAVRRYGMLLPYGVLLHWVLWQAPWGWGVLEALGIAVVLSTLIGRLLPVPLVGMAALAALVLGHTVAQSSWGTGGDMADKILGTGFPLVTYTGFGLFGAWAGWMLLRDHRRGAEALLAGGVLTLVVAVLTAAGYGPQRHPGTPLQFALPGVAFTLVLYGVLDVIRLRPAIVDTVIRRAGRHTLGVFLGHYVIYVALRALGLLGEVRPGLALGVAIVLTLAIVLIAPRMPELPWSPRTGRRQAPKTVSSSSGTGRSS